MEALNYERRQAEMRLGRTLGVDATHPRITAAAVQAMTEESNIAALPPSLDMPPAQLEDGTPVFVLGIHALDDPDAVIL